ncbi:MAG: LysM peptidoglycan-binding domain-containing protein, partial [Thermohalobaculum sp.]|nr:LysM peptidoglycan-binding domain-containing protein [Thermohalobaculum sp.]
GDAAATGAAAGSAVPQGEAAPAEPAGPAVAEASAAAAGETPAAEAAAEPAAAEPAQAALSAPVVILPSPDTAEAPVLVAPAAESVAVLQPAAGEAGRVVLDRITYSPGGDAVAAGRARPGHAVRAYANAVFVADAAVAPDGAWQVTLPRAAAEGAHLLRFDEVAANGEVASRLEMPFAYDDGATPVAARQRQIVVQRGDNLWRIAEQHYGQGLRYSVIFGANAGQIRDPDLIYPGQVFAIPELIATE